MEAILELFVALAVGLLELIFAWVQLFAYFLILIVEFVFVALTKGSSAASKRFQERQQSHRESSPEADIEAARARERRMTILMGLILTGIAATVITLTVRRELRRRPIAATQTQLEALADKFIAKIEDDEAVDPQSGLLTDRDAWDRRIELSVNRTLTGSNIVVRSLGPDRIAESMDDLRAMRSVRRPVKEAAREWADRGVRALGDRLKRLVPGKKDEESADEP